MADSTTSLPVPLIADVNDAVAEKLAAEYTYAGTVTDIYRTHSISFSFSISDSILSLLPINTLQPCNAAANTDLLKLITNLRTAHHDAIFNSYRSSPSSSVSRPCGVCSFRNLGRYRRVAVDLYYVFSTANLAERRITVKAVPVCKDLGGDCRKSARDALRSSIEMEAGVYTQNFAFLSESTAGPLPGVLPGNLGCELCAKKTAQAMKRCTGCKVAQYCDVDCQKRDWKRHKGECKGNILESIKEVSLNGGPSMSIEFLTEKKGSDDRPSNDGAPPAYY